MLIPHGYSRRRVAQTVHKLRRRRARLSGKDRAGVAEVMKTKVGSASGFPGRVVPAPHGRGPQLLAARRRNRRPLGPLWVLRRRCSRTIGARCSGTATSRFPTSVFGPFTTVWPGTKPTPRRTLSTHRVVSTSLRRNSDNSPLRRAHHAARSTMSRNRSGVASTSASSSSRDAGWVEPVRFTWPAPRMWTGFRSISSSSSAALRMLRSRS